MTTVILDANILVRLAQPLRPQHATTVAATIRLKATGHGLRTVPQAVYEFWVVATRPLANNGLGVSIGECEREITRIDTSFPTLDDPPGLFAEWRSVVTAFGCRGKVAHDARSVAARRVHGLSHLLTFNGADFARYPGLTVLDPSAVAGR